MAWTSRFSGAGVSDEDQFRVEAERPDGYARLQMGNAHAADANLRALRSRQWRHAIDRVARDRIDRNGGAAGVVAVESKPGVDVQLCTLPRPENRAAFR